jgi:hypothetical protein
MRYTDDVLVPSLTLSAETSANGNLQIRVGTLDIESGINSNASYIQYIPSGAATVTVPFSNISFDSASGVGLFETNIDASQVSITTPISISAVVYDNAGNHQALDKTVEMVVSAGQKILLPPGNVALH